MNKYKPYFRIIASAVAFMILCHIAGVYAAYLRDVFALSRPFAIAIGSVACALVVALMMFALTE